jgi:hypothetical protein
MAFKIPVSPVTGKSEPHLDHGELGTNDLAFEVFRFNLAGTK